MPRSTRQIAARILVTAVNQCMIATGNHLDLDSLRGAPPSGEA